MKTNIQARNPLLEKHLDYWVLVTAAAILCYPFLLNAFHAVVGTAAVTQSLFSILGEVLVLGVAFSVPFLGITIALRPSAGPRARRLAYASVAAPTLYVFLGVV